MNLFARLKSFKLGRKLPATAVANQDAAFAQICGRLSFNLNIQTEAARQDS